MSTRTVITIAVADRAAAERALDALARMEGGAELHATALVHRAADGRISVGDYRENGVEVAETPVEPTGLAALLSLVVGFVDAFVLGNSLMSVTGAAPASDRAAIERFARLLPPNRYAAVAEVTEHDTAAVDRIAAEAGATTERHPANEF